MPADIKVGDEIPVRFVGLRLPEARAHVFAVADDMSTIQVEYLDGIFKGLNGLIRLPRSRRPSQADIRLRVKVGE